LGLRGWDVSAFIRMARSIAPRCYKPAHELW
jgi:hypothetical protein